MGSMAQMRFFTVRIPKVPTALVLIHFAVVEEMKNASRDAPVGSTLSAS